MILAGLLPPIGNFFASLPDSVVGGCTIMMFGSILTSGVQMIASCGCCRNRIHHSKRERDLEYFPVDHTVRFCAKCSCCCIYHLHCFKLYPA